jgi:hypothetical protein
VTQSEFTWHLRSRIGPGGRQDTLAFVYVWFMSVANQARDTWNEWGDHWRHWYYGCPVLVVIHWPLVRYVSRSIASIIAPHQWKIVVALMGLVTLR